MGPLSTSCATAAVFARACPADHGRSHDARHGTASVGGRGRALLRARPRRLRRGRLSNEDRGGALLGLDSTYRVCGRHVQAVASLRCGAEEFSPDGALRTFLAMALFNTGELHESAWLLLRGRFLPLFHPGIGCLVWGVGSRQEMVFSR